MANRKFHLGDVLSITSRHLLSPDGVGGIYKILNYMTRDNLYTSQLTRAAIQCRPYLFDQYPILTTPEVEFEIMKLREMANRATSNTDREQLIAGWLLSFQAQFGLEQELEIARLPGDDYMAQDIVEELEQQFGPEKIITIDVPIKED